MTDYKFSKHAKRRWKERFEGDKEEIIKGAKLYSYQGRDRLLVNSNIIFIVNEDNVVISVVPLSFAKRFVNKMNKTLQVFIESNIKQLEEIHLLDGNKYIASYILGLRKRSMKERATIMSLSRERELLKKELAKRVTEEEMQEIYQKIDDIREQT